MPASNDRKRAKADALAEDGALNPAPEKVCDPKFQEGGFFDPRDVVQVKYEMLRRVAISTADKFNGADLGIREEWIPLFDKCNVDLVVCGHEHHYERSHPIHGHEDNSTLTPITLSASCRRAPTSRATKQKWRPA